MGLGVGSAGGHAYPGRVQRVSQEANVWANAGRKQVSTPCGPQQDDPGRGTEQRRKCDECPRKERPHTFPRPHTLIPNLGPDVFGNSEFSRFWVILCMGCVLVTHP